MDFTIYTLGDLESFRAALTAVAMFFNPSNTTAFVGESGLVGNEYKIGLGGMATVALMFALIVALLKGVMTLKFELGELIVIVFLYAILFVPKFDVLLEDYYTGDVAKIDNVPLGIAFPGAFISAFTINMSETLAQGYQTARGQQFTMRDGGFAYPLKILNGLRRAGNQLPVRDPNLARSIQTFYLDCANGRDTFDENEYAKSAAPWNYLKTRGEVTQGITMHYSKNAPSGAPMACVDAADLIDDTLTTYDDPVIDPAAPATVANPSGVSRLMGMVCANMGSGQSEKKGCPTTTDYENAFQILTNSSGAQARDFAITTLISQTIHNASMCASSAANNSDMARCLPLAGALEQYKEDGAAGGSMFRKTMLSSMSVMLFLFYCFAPIVAVLMLAMGAQGMKLVGSYLMFGIWTQSWLPFATILNFYIQNKVESEVARYGGANIVINPSNYQAFYDSVSTSLGVASDLLAATPIITLALLTGSIFALTGVASRLSGRDYYDEKVNNPAPVTNGPVAMNTSAFSGTMGKVTGAQGLQEAASINVSDSAASIKSAASSVTSAANQSFERAASTAVSEVFAKTNSFSQAYDFAKTNGLLESQGVQRALSDAATQTMSTSAEERAAQAGTSATQAGLSGGVGVSKGIQLGGNLSKTWADQQTQSEAFKTDRDQAESYKKSFDENKSFGISSGMSSSERLEKAQRLEAATRGEFSESTREAIARSVSASEMASKMDSVSSAVMSSANIDAATVAARMGGSAGQALNEDISSVTMALSGNSAYASTYEENLRYFKSTNAGQMSGAGVSSDDLVHNMAVMKTAQQLSPAAFTGLVGEHFLPGHSGAAFNNDNYASLRAEGAGVQQQAAGVGAVERAIAPNTMRSLQGQVDNGLARGTPTVDGRSQLGIKTLDFNLQHQSVATGAPVTNTTGVETYSQEKASDQDKLQNLNNAFNSGKEGMGSGFNGIPTSRK